MRELGDRHGEAQTLGNLGLALRARGDENGARRHLGDALGLFEAFGASETEKRGLSWMPNRGDRGGDVAVQRAVLEALSTGSTHVRELRYL